ncbi:MAG: DUF6011 domain-containing protein, partial [Blastocatellia bacterium]
GVNIAVRSGVKVPIRLTHFQGGRILDHISRVVERFEVRATADGWKVEARSIVVHPNGSWYDRAPAAANRLVSELTSGKLDELSVGLMLSPRCLVCGRKLTDAVSMARMIGPECSGHQHLRPDHVIDTTSDVVALRRSPVPVRAEPINHGDPMPWSLLKVDDVFVMEGDRWNIPQIVLRITSAGVVFAEATAFRKRRARGRIDTMPFRKATSCRLILPSKKEKAA